MKFQKSSTAAVAALLAIGGTVTGIAPAHAATATSCAAITKALVVSDGYTAATAPSWVSSPTRRFAPTRVA